ncbi:polysaccharide lyase family 7 protein [Neotamlana laminarinivorans]|uniref:Polysaccharide lyase family 7 protein n=1 Tax=Neotamlana laminarinivorans TaxID=2883124 RepID=A0A9X1HXT6_9FLAO|nr:polysaccharide lyase family 7 protein [Tamlana laminarinivorans]MCB4797556.1 polysaccharide lyase family 7 protein [Tamlana laminarinivorans]
MKLITNYTLSLLICFLFNCSSSENITEEEDIIMEEEIDDSGEDDDETNNDDEAQNIIWKNWYLSVPINRGDGSATSIFYEAIENDNLTTAQKEYFYKNDDGSYTLYTKFTGYTTSGESELGDKYCRTELREYWQGNQTTTDNWSMTTGTHILETTMKIDFVEGNGRTIIAQIHGKESTGISGNPATVKIRWNSGTIQLDYYTKPDAGEAWTSAFDDKIDVANVGNDIFTFKIKIENGKFYYALVCEAKSIDIDYTFVYDYVSNGYVHENYFKTGNYFGWHDDYKKASQVTLYKVVTEHN